jgi:peptidoglycan pentaglycine glycine transferase (the first glycine)
LIQGGSFTSFPDSKELGNSNMPVVSLSKWTQFLAKFPHAHLLQTGEWGELKASFGWSTVRLVSEDGLVGVQILFRNLPLGLTFAYIPKGPVGENPARLWPEVHQTCGHRGAVFLKLEMDNWDRVDHKDPSEREANLPENILSGFRTSPHNFQPPRTILVNLHGSEEDILARMKQKTRYNIRLSQKKGVSVRPWDNLPAFHRMMLVTGSRDGFGVHSLEYYRRAYELFRSGNKAQLLVAEYEGRPLAALMVFASGRRAWYLYGASTEEERNRMPTYFLQWEAIRWARAQGAEEYDLWGVPDEDHAGLEEKFTQRHDGLWGVYRFKRGFGGETKRAAQAMDFVYRPLLYRLYSWLMASRVAD